MRVPRLIEVTVLMALAVAPALAQQSAPPAADPPNAELNATAIGLPVFSSDGQKLGEVTQVGTTGGHPAVLADIAEFLGIGPRTVVIPATLFQQRSDRFELAMTAAEVRDTISRQEKKEQE